MVIDHGINGLMKEVAISEFKAKCLGMIEEVRRTRKPIRVTRFGKPVAEVIPASPEKIARRPLGCMAGTAEILGDIVGPTGSLDDWEAWRE
jgi:prevent-host-death family protein